MCHRVAGDFRVLMSKLGDVRRVFLISRCDLVNAGREYQLIESF